jgi:hypothetical protein
MEIEMKQRQKQPKQQRKWKRKRYLLGLEDARESKKGRGMGKNEMKQRNQERKCIQTARTIGKRKKETETKQKKHESTRLDPARRRKEKNLYFPPSSSIAASNHPNAHRTHNNTIPS